MFRYLIYRTDFGNTIVAESSTPITGGTTGSTFTDFVIPEIQPLYLWRVTGGTDVVPNTDLNINAWLDNEYPPSPDDAVTYNIFTGYTAQTQTDLDGKINIVTGATGNVGVFTVDGNLIDTGLSIADITGLTGNDRYVSGMTYVGSTLTLQRTQGLPDLTVTIVSTGNTDGVVSGATLSGATLVLSRTEGLPDVTADLSGLLTDVEADIISLSGQVDQNTTDIQLVSGVTTQNTNNITTISGDVVQNTTDIQTISGDVVQNTTDITTVSGITVQNAADIVTISGDVVQNSVDIVTISGDVAQNTADIATVSGITAGKQDQLTAGEGINVAAFAADTIQVDLSAFTAIGGLDITLTGGTNAVINDLRTIAKGLEYGGDYNANFTVRSLVDKGYVDAVAAGLDLKESVVVATTTGETDIILTGGFSGVIDGVTLADGDRVLIKNQDSAKEENGIYIWSNGSSGFTRSIDFVDPNVTAGAFTFVETGSTNGGSGWVLVTQDPITIGTTELTFTKFSSTGSLTAGNGIDITNGIVSIAGDELNGDFLQWTGSQFNVTGLTTLVQFNAYTGATDTRLNNVEGDIITISGDVTQNTSDIATLSGNSVTITDFNAYTGATDTRLNNVEGDIITISGDVVQNTSDIATLSGITETKLDTSIFTGYTASTQSNELFLIHTGGTDINTIIATGIVWNSGVTIGSSYSWTGGSEITILEAGTYEITYNIPFNHTSGGQDKAIGGNIVLNGGDVIDLTSSAGITTSVGQAGSVGLPTINLTFSVNDTIDLVCFRTGGSGNGVTSPNGMILIKKKNTLQ